VASFCAELANECWSVIKRGARLAVIGGDHSCAMGTWSGVYRALNNYGEVGLIWVDAHMDAHTPETSHSGALHGMPLAALLGYGDPQFTDIGTPGRKLLPENVCLVGVRSYEPEEAALLHELGVKVFYMDEIQQRGLNAVMQDARTIVTQNTVGFGITIDLDALDPADAPGVGSPVPGGLRGSQLIEALEPLKDSMQLLGVEIVEFNPRRDTNQQTAKLAEALLLATL
jgi:arginase